MLNAIQGVKLYAHCYTWSEALCPLLSAILGGKHLLIVTHRVRLYDIHLHGVKIYVYCYKRCEA